MALVENKQAVWGERSSLHGMYLEDVDDRKIELDTPCPQKKDHESTLSWWKKMAEHLMWRS